MRETNLSARDLNLLPALDALLRRRAVSLAAADVGLSQPAMSRALARLRDVHGDPLLVRGAGGYVLTPLAESLQAELGETLPRLRRIYAPEAFDPAAVSRTIRLTASDAQTVVLLPEVMRRLAIEAPNVDVRVESYASTVIQRILSGALDLAFALESSPLPVGAYSEVVAEDRVALVMRRGHPAAGRDWTLEDFAAHDHVGVAILGDGQSEIDALLAARGLARRQPLVTPHFTAALATVAATDMVTTLSRALALRFAPAFDLVLKAPPLPTTEIRMTLVCSHVRATDPLLTWFRTLVREAGTAVLSV